MDDPKNNWRQKSCSEKSDADYMVYWKSRCIVTEKGCWEWQGFCHAFRNMKPGQIGYPVGGYRSGNARLHKKSVEIKLGRLLDKGELACHTCDNPPCINPDHLFAGTQSQNKLDELAKGRSFYANKTHCKRGHPFDEKNTYISLNPKGRERRHCKACQNERQKARWHAAPEHRAKQYANRRARRQRLISARQTETKP